ncbi:MAG TPA: hypothetical protein VMR62_25620 [Bryobacteraceae bacterium]|jgi:hypothetical protein|nr:hypothetical protein [Bryobacteraceae bacterium]
MSEENFNGSAKREGEERKLWLDQLVSEYRILQDKIDKIAGFRFTIRGWSVTLVIASSIGAVTANLSPGWVLCGLIPFIVAFLCMEQAQLRNRRTFGRRVIDIERRIAKILNEGGGSGLARMVGRIPRIAHELEEEAARRNPTLRAIERRGDFFFYALPVLAILAVAWSLTSRNVKAPEKGQGSVTIYNNAAETPAPPRGSEPFQNTAPDSARQKDGQKKNQSRSGQR